MRKVHSREANTRHKKPSNGKAPISRLSHGFISNIYQAITGNVQIPQHFVRRALANGLPEPELQDAIRCARTAVLLPDYLLSAAEQKFERAVYWDELGLKTRARDLYLEAALWALNAELLIDDEEKRNLVWQKYRESYRRAAPYFAHPAEEISINYLATALSGYFRVPASAFDEQGQLAIGPVKLPVIVLLNGLFTAREELHYFENSLLSQGFATVTIDYPGTQAHSAHVPSSFDVKELANSIYLFLSTRPEVDCSRISLYGQSVGGRIAIQMALAFPERFCSIVSMSTPIDLLSNLDKLSAAFAREHMVPTSAARASLYELALHTEIEQNIQHIESPLLVLGGGKDRVTSAEQTRILFDRSLSSDKKLVLSPGAGHCLYEMMPSLRYDIAQWFRQRATVFASTPVTE